MYGTHWGMYMCMTLECRHRAHVQPNECLTSDDHWGVWNGEQRREREPSERFRVAAAVTTQTRGDKVT